MDDLTSACDIGCDEYGYPIRSLPRARDLNEMVERVGAALRAACLEEFGTNWSNDAAWRFACAAISAMRKPTEAMPGTTSLARAREPEEQ